MKPRHREISVECGAKLFDLRVGALRVNLVECIHVQDRCYSLHGRATGIRHYFKSRAQPNTPIDILMLSALLCIPTHFE